jgi:predicted Zn-dependent protease
LNRYAEAKAMFDQAVAKFDTEYGHAGLYRLAWIEGDTAGMERQVAWYRAQRSEFLTAPALVAAFGGQVQRSRDLRRRAVELAKRGGGTEQPANLLSFEAVFEAQIGNLPRARESATAALGLARSRQALFRAALVEALAGSSGPAKVLLDELIKRYPLDTLVNDVAVPVAQAALEISRGNPRRAVELLEPAAPYELGWGIGCEHVLQFRGQAHLKAGSGKEAAAAFQKILDHRGAFVAAPHYSLAWLGLGRAQALAANTAAARKAYQDFLAAWKDADPGVPILKQARQEYARLPQ